MNNNLNNNLRRRVMARIYFEYTKNVLWEYPDYFMFAIFVVTAFTMVSIRDVLMNLPKDNFSNIFNFLVAALRSTNVLIQILIVGFFVRVIVGGSILAYKNISSHKWPLAKLIKLKY
jgi:hypothetical protein